MIVFADWYKKTAETADPRLQLLNAGVGGYATGHVKKLLDRHLPRIRPSAVIYFFNNNDLIDTVVTDIDYRVTELRVGPGGRPMIVDVQPYAPWKRFALNRTPYAWLNRHSHLFVLSKDLLKRAIGWSRAVVRPKVDQIPLPPRDGTPPPEADAGAAPQPAYTMALPSAARGAAELERMVYVSELHVRRLARRAAAAGVPMLLVWVPAPEEMSPPARETAAVRLLGMGRAMLTRLAAEEPGLTFVDTVPAIPGDAQWRSAANQLRLADGHFNAAGAAWYAALVAPPVLEFLKAAGSAAQ